MLSSGLAHRAWPLRRVDCRGCPHADWAKLRWSGYL